MSIHVDEAFVLGTSPYSNTSLIATFFAKKEGKIRVVARGARSPKQNWGGFRACHAHPGGMVDAAGKGSGHPEVLRDDIRAPWPVERH